MNLFYSALEANKYVFKTGLVDINSIQEINQYKIQNCISDSWNKFKGTPTNELFDEVIYQVSQDRPYSVPTLFIDDMEYKVRFQL